MPPSATASTFQIGAWNALTDVFTQTLDLNDGTTWFIANGGLKLPQPDKTIIMSGNVRTAGVVVPRWQYKERHIQVEVMLRGASTTAILSSVRSLIAAIEQPPYAIRLALPGSSSYSYADVMAVKHDIPNDPQILLAKAITKIHMDFTCAVGLRGDRVTLQNLVVNPGFEQPSGPSVLVFNDAFANGNAYTVQQGSAPTVASSVMTIPAGTRLLFGSPAWGSLNLWQVRFQFVTGGDYFFYLHFTDANNTLRAEVTGSALALQHRIAGVTNVLASSAPTLTNGNFYWLQMTQFPAAPGEVADVQVALFNDSAGSVGSAVASGSVGPVPTFDAVTALVGRPAILASTGSLKIGGAFSNVHTVSLFGPGGWLLNQSAGDTPVSGAWEGQGLSSANTRSGGPVLSFGAARIDAPPAGTWDATWRLYLGGTPSGTWALPLRAAGDTLNVTAWVKSSGLSASAAVRMVVSEYDASGSFLRNGTAGATLTGNQASWIQVGGDYTTGASCAWIDVECRAADVSAGGASANASVWFDNAQCWNKSQLSTMSSMPYCELRFPQSPAQLLVSGVVGDMVAPAFIAMGTFLSNWPTSGTMQLFLGRKLQASQTAQLVGQSYGAFSASFSPQATAVLDSGSWGGFYSTASVGTGGWNPRAFSTTAWDASGVYHLLSRAYSAQTVPNLTSLSFRVVVGQQTDPWLNLVSGADIVGQWTGPYVYPITAQNTWTLTDAGQCILPPFAQGALTNPQALFLIPRPQWQDTSGSPQAGRANWQALMPIDGCLLMATLNNPSNSAGAVTNSWLWIYADGLLVNRGGANDLASWALSNEPAALPNPSAAYGGPGTQGSGSPNVNTAADSYLTLDPTPNNSTAMPATAAGVNQIVAVLADQAGAVLPFYGEVSYSPLYLYPR